MDPEQNDSIVRLTPEETEFTVRAYEISGRKIGFEAPFILEDDRMIIDEVSALAVRNFVIRNGEVSDRLDQKLRQGLIFEAGSLRSKPSNEQQERVREKRKEMQSFVSQSRSIGQQLTKYFDLPDHEFLEDNN